jgi:hypothetical protein
MIESQLIALESYKVEEDAIESMESCFARKIQSHLRFKAASESMRLQRNDIEELLRELRGWVKNINQFAQLVREGDETIERLKDFINDGLTYMPEIKK